MLPSRLGTGLAVCLLSAACLHAGSWRSALYPADWTPGFADAQGRSLNDFSYAGYHQGRDPLPDPKAARETVDATQPPYSADATGRDDSTAAIQAALDAAAAKSGGAVVWLPPGTYRVRPPEGKAAALRIAGDDVVLRGAGPDKTFLYNDSVEMRGKCVIQVESAQSADWLAAKDPATPLAEDAARPARRIRVADATPFVVGDAVVVRNDLTQHYIDLIGMTGKWTPAESPNRTLAYYRHVVGIDPGDKALVLDIPLRGFLYVADNARVAKAPGHMIREVGLEEFSLGMKELPGGGLDDDEKKNSDPAATAYGIHASTAIRINRAEDCWMRHVDSYRPSGNPDDIHVLSNGVHLKETQNVTLYECDWGHTQYQGGGGNGYGYVLHGADSLLWKCRGEACRHNYSFGTMQASGNVLVDCVAKDGRLNSDFHMFLSLANLIDNMTFDGDCYETVYRPWGGKPVHGITSTESVFWNENGLRYPAPEGEYGGKTYPHKQAIVLSRQFGNGYVIGTRGPAPAVETTNFVEGVGQGETLEPRSLYLDQFARRLRAAGGRGGD